MRNASRFTPSRQGSSLLIGRHARPWAGGNATPTSQVCFGSLAPTRDLGALGAIHALLRRQRAVAIHLEHNNLDQERGCWASLSGAQTIHRC